MSTLTQATGAGPAEVARFLVDHGVVAADARLSLEPLGGGVSSDIWIVSDGASRVVVKSPLAELKVEDDWSAPVERSRSEVDWLCAVGRLVPGACPAVLAHDDVRHLLALEYLDPADHRLWKQDLLDGRVDGDVAAAVGARLGEIHRLTSERPRLADRFATDHLFVPLRIEPYFERLVQRYPNLAESISGVVRRTMTSRFALVHGDVSPKNILIGPDGPVFLDAETAWWGDPAFDVAFCLNHLLLKGLLPGHDVAAHVAAVESLFTAYAEHVTWEGTDQLESRVAGLLPTLMLARVDGRSPVEYLGQAARTLVRRFTVPRIHDGPHGLSELCGDWKAALA